MSEHKADDHHAKRAKAAPDLELFYFDIPGKGEAIRLLAKHARLELKDTRLSRDEFEKLRDTGVLAFGQMPALLSDGKYIVQSAAILRFIGKITGHYPTDPYDAALVDSIMDAEIDLFMGLSVSRYRERFGFQCIDSSAVGTIRSELNDNVIPKHLAFLERLLDKSSSGWITGSVHPTIADFCLVPRLEWLQGGNNDGISVDILKPFPKLISLITKLHEAVNKLCDSAI
jgi:prostaglandin-H2 D-isomerase / glutathione transferase